MLATLTAAALMTGLARAPMAVEPVAPYWHGVFPDERPGAPFALRAAWPRLGFVDPVGAGVVPRTPGKLFVVGKDGVVHFVAVDAGTSTTQVFLDVRARVQQGVDTGLMGLAFHPEFGEPSSPHRDEFFVAYQYSPAPVVNPDGVDERTPSYFRLSRFSRRMDTGTADPASEQVLIQQFDRNLWHMGGALRFGPDGLLYVTVGDEGGANDEHGNGQRLDGKLFGGLLRLDVDCVPERSHPLRRQPAPSYGMPAGWPASVTGGYCIPNDNPWVREDGSTLEEFYALGLRSPHSLTLDAATGRMFVGDVGQRRVEEIDLVARGANFGWPFREGNEPGPQPRPETVLGTLTEPVHAYDRSVGAAIVVGPVYRGTLHAATLGGKLLFGDHVTGNIWALDVSGRAAAAPEFVAKLPRSGFKIGLGAFGEDADRELLICEVNGPGDPGGAIYRLESRDPQAVAPPQWLSATGLFADLASLRPRDGLRPYAVNAPLWSDGAEKRRWIAIPNDGVHDTPAERVTFAADAPWRFPPGTVFVKHFELTTAAGPTRRLETRVLVRDKSQGLYGLTYRWLDDHSDARLLDTRETETLEVRAPDGAVRRQTWTYPSREDCGTCHSANAGLVLGVNTQQLNGPTPEGASNQLVAWSELGIVDPPVAPEALSALPRAAGLDDASASAEHRIKSYLDVNCAHCHRPGGAPVRFDARLVVPLARQGLVNGALAQDYGTPGARVVRPGMHQASIAWRRLGALDNLAMPPLQRSVVDTAAAAAMAAWIDGLAPADFPEPTARYVKLVALSEVSGAAWTAAAELRVIESDGREVPAARTRLVSVDSEAAANRGVNLLDGDLATFWLTETQPEPVPLPHSVVLDLGTALPLSGLRYWPRQGDERGRIKDYVAYLSLDGETWTEAARGQLGSGGAAQLVVFRANGERALATPGTAAR